MTSTSDQSGADTPVTPPPRPGQLTFSAPRRGKPPTHLADLSPEERKAFVESLGHKGFRARQLSTHYFERLVSDADEMTDLPKGRARRPGRRCAAGAAPSAAHDHRG
jgi:23S rRNA (adenine2503-C2)-methyltransferase